MNTRVLRAGITALGLTLVAGTASAALHLRLTQSRPGNGETLAAPPAELRLWFSQRPQAAVTSVTLLAADSTRLALGGVTPTEDSMAVAAAVKAPLAPGEYRVLWRTQAADGHVVRGSYPFRVAGGN